MEAILTDIRSVVSRGDFTLGREVEHFEEEFASMCGVRHAVGVGNGTDALFLAMKSLLNYGDHVITTPYSFYATTASIVNAGYTPVFVDVGRDFNIDPSRVQEAITPRTGGIVVVHWAGRPCDMAAIMGIAEMNNLWVIEDCAHAHNSTYHGRKCGSFGDVNAFSLHPLKNVNVWGDGGVITTDRDDVAAHLRKLRNHGMSDRNTCDFWGYNSRLDTVQAVVAWHVLMGIEQRTKIRRANALKLDWLLKDIPGVELPLDAPNTEPNYYLYSFHAPRRDDLQNFLVFNGVDAKVHYPTPLHLQPAAKSLGYKRGDFPVAEWCAATTLSLPIHEFITSQSIERMAGLIKEFYG